MVLLGGISLLISINYDSSILAFVGLGLIFWGAILLYIKPEEYVRERLLEAVTTPSLITLNQIIQELGYKGDTIYLPPRCFTNPDNIKMLVSKYKYSTVPTLEQMQPYENQPIARTTQGLLVTPSGIELSTLLEEELGKSFIQTDLESLKQNLPGLFIEKLEIAQNLELQTENNISKTKKSNSGPLTQLKTTTIHAIMTRPIYGEMIKQAEESSQVAGLIGGPICSAIAIALTKATGKPVRITNIKSSEDGNVIEASYEIVEE
jgi:hypothetical protein